MNVDTRTVPARKAWVEQIMGMPISIHLRGEAALTQDGERAVA